MCPTPGWKTLLGMSQNHMVHYLAEGTSSLIKKNDYLPTSTVVFIFQYFIIIILIKCLHTCFNSGKVWDVTLDESLPLSDISFSTRPSINQHSIDGHVVFAMGIMIVLTVIHQLLDANLAAFIGSDKVQVNVVIIIAIIELDIIILTKGEAHFNMY